MKADFFKTDWNHNGTNNATAMATRTAAPPLAGRQRAVDHFSWKSSARKTLALYKTLAV